MLAENSIRWASRARDGPGDSRQDRRRSWHRGPGFPGGQTFRPAQAFGREIEKVRRETDELEGVAVRELTPDSVWCFAPMPFRYDELILPGSRIIDARDDRTGAPEGRPMDLSPATLIPLAVVLVAMLAWAYFDFRSNDPI